MAARTLGTEDRRGLRPTASSAPERGPAAEPRRRSALDTASDAVLTARAADGDESAFAVLVRRHAPYLRAFASRFVGSSIDADDAVQDALIVAWDRLPTLENPANVRSWLTTIVVRKATDRIRSRPRTDPLPDDDAAVAEPAVRTDPELAAETADRLDALAAVLDGLDVDSRRIWLLKTVGGCSYDDIATRLDLPLSTVRGRLARARAIVLERMRAWR